MTGARPRRSRHSDAPRLKQRPNVSMKDRWISRLQVNYVFAIVYLSVCLGCDLIKSTDGCHLSPSADAAWQRVSRLTPIRTDDAAERGEFKLAASDNDDQLTAGLGITVYYSRSGKTLPNILALIKFLPRLGA
jgi:hypothetical protein